MRNALIVLFCGCFALGISGAPVAGAESATPPAAPGKPTPLTLEAVFGPNALGRRTAQRTWRPDGQRLSYLWSESGDPKDESFWTMDPATGRAEVVVRLTDLKEGDEDFIVAEYVWSPRSDAVLFVSHGDLYLFPLAAHKLRRLTHSEADEQLPSFSPDGSRIAFVRDFDLYTLDAATGHETRLTTDGRENSVLNGICDWVYEEEIWDRLPESYWWSPDGSRLAFYHFDETGVGVYPLEDFSPQYPEVRWQKYPKAGTPNPKVKIGVIAATGGPVTWLGTGDDDVYLARVAWLQGSAVAVQRLNRAQNQIDLLRCAAGAGDHGACSTLLTESWPTWVNLGRDFAVLPDGRFLLGSDRSGWRRLYLYAADGRLIRPVTPEGWALAGLSAVAEDGTWVQLMTYETRELGAIDRHVARVRIGEARDTWEVLTPETGTHVAVTSPKSGNWVHITSTADTVPHGELRTAAGTTPPFPLPGTAPAFDPDSLPKWEFFTLPGPDGSRLPARLLKPDGFDPTRRYPAIFYHYGGPGSQVVENAWAPRAAWAKLMAQRGFVMFMVDNQSSIFFGKAGEDRDHRHMGPINLAAQLAGVNYLKSLPWIDGSRLGLWGWSGGGYNTLFCLLNRPGVWKAGVAGAPVTDWDLYDSIWTERYMGQPKDNPDGYRDSSAITYSNNLADRLLIVHGLADDNVHPQNSVVMSRDLVRAGKPFEQAFYPGQRHSLVGAPLRHFYQRMTEFFERELQVAK